MNRTRLVSGLLVALLMAPLLERAAISAPKTVEGEVTEVTLYRGQAMVTRTIPVEGPKGGLELIVSGLPENTVSGSLFAESGDSLEVRAVQFRNRAVGEEPREEVRKLDEQLEAQTHKIEVNMKNQQIMAKRLEYLDKLEAFVSGTAKTDLEKGVLDATALEKLTLMSFEHRASATDEQIKLTQEARELNKEMTLLQRKRGELTSGSTRSVREAVLFIRKINDGAESVRLSYLVDNCGWSPTYTMRASTEQAEVSVEYNALIHQMSGEDWTNVKLLLSTASPGLSAAGPGLAPFRVSLSSGNAKQQQVANQQDFVDQVQSIKGGQQSAVIMNRNADNLRDNNATAWSINGFANQLQQLELDCEIGLIGTLNNSGNENGEGPSLSYELATAVSLPSRSDRQMVRILNTGIPSKVFHVATPVLTGYVYREAEMTNISQEDLLAGPVSVYLDGRFVGRTEIPTVTRGQTFVVGFGADPQLRTRREVADKLDSVQGGNRELKFSYRLIVENYKDQEVALRIIDRLPVSDRSTDVRVSLGDTTDELSTDAVYVRRERPTGILRWDIKVEPKATGEESRVIEYSYTVEYDRNFQLSTPSGTQQLQQEFEELQRGRQKR